MSNLQSVKYWENVATTTENKRMFSVNEKIEYISNDSDYYYLYITFIDSNSFEQTRKIEPREQISDIFMNCSWISVKSSDDDSVGGSCIVNFRISAR